LSQRIVITVYHSIEEFSEPDPMITMGVFDGVHTGHRFMLQVLQEKAKENGWTPLVITFWPHPRIVLNGSSEKLKYLTTLHEKLQLMEKQGIEHVLVLPFDETVRNLTACDFVINLLAGRLKAKGLLMGFNHHFGKNRKGDYETIRKCTRNLNFHVERLEAVKKGEHQVSSTMIRDLLWSGEIEQAEKLLGYRYFITGMIVSGNKLGRNLGFPTANVQPFDEHKLLPRDGVYVAKAIISGRPFYGMLNVGIRPTLKDTLVKKTVEIHLFDFHGDIYGQDVRVSFLKRIRDELTFENIDVLRNQLKKDRAISLQWLNDRNLY